MRTVKLDPNSEYSFKFIISVSNTYPVTRTIVKNFRKFEVDVEDIHYSLKYHTNKAYDVWKGNYKGKVMGSDLASKLGWSLNPMVCHPIHCVVLK